MTHTGKGKSIKSQSGFGDAKEELQAMMNSGSSIVVSKGGVKAPNVQWVLVTPELANAMLERNSNNRTIREKYVMEIKNDLMAGRWLFASNMISFYEDGELSDGQHRLAAIASSGESVYSLVAFGVKREAAVYIDRGRARSSTDSIRILEGEKLFNSRISAVLKLSFAGGDVMNTAEECRLFNQYKEQFLWVNDKMIAMPPKIKNAITGSALFLALVHGADEEKLDRFATVMADGQTDGSEGEASIINVREWLLRSKNSPTMSDRRERVGRIQNAYWNYSKGIKAKTKMMTTGMRYPFLTREK